MMRIACCVSVAVVVLSGGCSGGPDAPLDFDGRSASDIREDQRRSVELGDLRRDALALLVDATRWGDALTRANAYESLIVAPDTLGQVVGAGLLDENIGVRSIAAVSIGQAGVRGHEPGLHAMLADESAYARASAIFALAKLGHDVDRSPLAGFLLQGDPPGLRGHTAYLLGELGDASAVDLLRSAAEAPMELASQAERRVVELQLSEAMIKLGELQQLGPVRAALFPSQPGDLEAMLLAVQIVGEVGDRSSRGRLVQISETRDNAGQSMPPEVQLAVALSMAKLGDRQGWFIADEFWDSPREVLRADSAAVYGLTARSRDLDRLARMMEDRSGRVRVSAAAGILRGVEPGGGSGLGCDP